MTAAEPPRQATPLHIIAAADAPKEWVRQRCGHDCAIAALASAMDATYEEAAAVFGLTRDPVTGAVLGIDTGMMMLELGAPLLRNGWTGTLLFCDGISLVADTSAPAAARVAVQKRELANLLSGRRAILQVWKRDELSGPAQHFVAWRDGVVIDTVENGFAIYALDGIRVMLALVLEPCRLGRNPS